MNINPLSSNIINILANEQISAGVTGNSGNTETPEGSFADVLSTALQTASETDSLDKYSALQLLTGQADDLSGLILDAQKAELSLNLALQIRNKVIDAYNEIMRMQV